MKIKMTALAVSAALLMTAAAAQPTLTGTDLIVALAKARAVTLDPRALTMAGRLQMADFAKQLRLSPAVMMELRSTANKPVPALLATRAVLESVTGKAITDAQVAAFLQANPTLAVTDLASLSAFINNPGAANNAVQRAQTAVTPTGA